jgi:CBS domain-containing protein
MSEREIANEPVELRVHVRRVVSDDGMQSQNEVYCVRRRCCVAIAECEECPENAGAAIDFQRHRNHILCRGLTIDSARGLEPSRRPLLLRRPGTRDSQASHTPVAEILIADILCARESLSAVDLARELLNKRFGAAPVVDRAGRLVGMVAARDLVEAPPGVRVGAVMSRVVFWLPDDASIADAAALMALERVHHLPIITNDGKVCGMVSSLDVLGWMARQDGYHLGG